MHLKLTSYVALISFLAIACKPSGDSSAAQEDQTTTTTNTVTITPFAQSTDFPDAQLSLTSYEDGVFEFGVTSESYKLGEQTPDAPQKMCANSGEGQHIHLIVDDEPYAAKYTSTFDYTIPNGSHYILAFLSRSYHESIKTQSANILKKVEIADNSIIKSDDVTEPMLFYSRPKGTYVGEDAKKVMLDFYLHNVDMSQHMVKADINGETHMIDTWQPYYLEGLPMGENTITLTLQDKSGKIVNTPLNPVSRVFTLHAAADEKM